MCLVNASKQRQQRQQTINLPSVSEGNNFGGSNDSSGGGIDSRSTSRGNETKHRFSSTSQSRRQQDSCTSSAQPQREQWQRLRDAPINLSMQSAKQLNHRSERMPSSMSTKASIYSIDGSCSCNQRWSSMQSGARVRQVSFDARFFIPFAKGFVLRTNGYKLRRLFYLQTRANEGAALRNSDVKYDSSFVNLRFGRTLHDKCKSFIPYSYWLWLKIAGISLIARKLFRHNFFSNNLHFTRECENISPSDILSDKLNFILSILKFRRI
jgi:hypothetical protein